jgi:MFS family permease
MEQSGEAPYPSRPFGIYIISVLFMAWLMAYLDRQIVSLLVPSLKVDLSLSDTQVSLLQGMAFASFFAVAGVPLGRLADRTNRRNLIAAGVAFWSIATICCGLSTTYWQLFGSRMAVGLGEACLAPAAVSIMADFFRPNERGRAMGFMLAGTPIGSAVALFSGGFLLTILAAGSSYAGLFPDGWAHWKIVFVSVGAPGLMIAALVFTLPEPPRRGRTQPAPGAALGGPKFGAFLKQKGLAVGMVYAMFSCLFIIGYSVSGWAPALLMRVHEFTPAQAGATYGTILLVCSASANITSGFVSDFLRKRRPLDGRILLPMILLPLEIGFLGMFAITDSAVVTVTLLACSTVTTALVSSSAYAALQDLAPNQLRGQVIAVYLLVANLIGLGLAPTFVGLVTDYVFRDEMMLQRSMGLVGVSAAIVGFLLGVIVPRIYAAARRQDLEPAETPA